VAFDAQGVITNAYDSADCPVPDGVTNVIEITDEQYAAVMNTKGGWSAWFVANDTLEPVPPPTSAQLLADAQTGQIAVLSKAYQQAIQQDVCYTSELGVTQTYQADSGSQTRLMQAAQGFGIAGATPPGFYWVAADNTQVSFSLEDLQGLFSAMVAQSWTAFQKWQTLKARVAAAESVEELIKISW